MASRAAGYFGSLRSSPIFLRRRSARKKRRERDRKGSFLSPFHRFLGLLLSIGFSGFCLDCILLLLVIPRSSSLRMMFSFAWSGCLVCSFLLFFSFHSATCSGLSAMVRFSCKQGKPEEVERFKMEVPGEKRLAQKCFECLLRVAGFMVMSTHSRDKT